MEEEGRKAEEEFKRAVEKAWEEMDAKYDRIKQNANLSGQEISRNNPGILIATWNYSG